MIKLQGKLPKYVTLACSGGVDSMAILDFLYRRHNLAVIYINHGTDYGNRMEDWLDYYVNKHYPDAYFISREISTTEVPAGVSQEEHWRNERYSVFHAAGDMPVITCHHLDDCVETYLWSAMHGEGKIIPYRNQNVIRPFRLNCKSEFENWCERNKVLYFEDPSNTDTKYTRNYIRHEMMPHVLRINPGIHKVIAKKVKADVDIG